MNWLSRLLAIGLTIVLFGCSSDEKPLPPVGAGPSEGGAGGESSGSNRTPKADAGPDQVVDVGVLGRHGSGCGRA